jgi:hypothetical protein
MPCTLREAKAKVKQAKAKKAYPKAVAKAVKRNKETVSTAGKALAKGNAGAERFKGDMERANTAAFKARIGKLKPDNVNAVAGVLKTLIAQLREPS